MQVSANRLTRHEKHAYILELTWSGLMHCPHLDNFTSNLGNNNKGVDGS